MIENVTAVRADAVVGEAAKMKADGYRFVTLSCVELDENSADILYHFDKALQMRHLRLTVAKDVRVPSISGVYLAAFLAENEIQDLFGIRFEGLAVDYDRTLYLESEVTSAPFCRYVTVRSGACGRPGDPAT